MKWTQTYGHLFYFARELDDVFSGFNTTRKAGWLTRKKTHKSQRISALRSIRESKIS